MTIRKDSNLIKHKCYVSLEELSYAQIFYSVAFLKIFG